MSGKEPTHVNSAGFLLKCGGLYLIAHPSFDPERTQGWGIPKGRLNKGEEAFQGAIREFQEETNLDLLKNEFGIKIHEKSKLTYTAKIKDNYIKTYHVFFAETDNLDLLAFPFSCPSLLDSGKPEIAQYRWTTLDEARAIAAKSQRPLFDFFINERDRLNNKEAVQVEPSGAPSETL